MTLTRNKQRVYVEDAVEFAKQSETYRKVIAHRMECRDWRTQFCLECFGGGLTQFTKDLAKESKKGGENES